MRNNEKKSGSALKSIVLYGTLLSGVLMMAVILGTKHPQPLRDLPMAIAIAVPTGFVLSTMFHLMSSVQDQVGSQFAKWAKARRNRDRDAS